MTVPPYLLTSDVRCYRHGNSFAIRVRQYRLPSLFNPSPRTPIGLPFDGQFFSFTNLDEAEEQLEILAAIGYHVPPQAFEELRTDRSKEN